MPEMTKYISGHCILEKEARAGIIKTSDAERFHRQCRNNDGKCHCPHHSDNEQDCKFCGTMVVGADQCSDKEACEARMSKRLEGQRRTAELEEMSTRSKEKTNVAKREARPKGSGRCEHCGEPTSGGKFKMGHDMKLKGELFRAVRNAQTPQERARSVHALAELMIRGWVPKDLDQASEPKPTKVWQMAERIYNNAANRDQFLADRIKGRTDG